MDKGAASLGKVITMTAFALSCFGLLLFLWLSFGGNIPLRAQGYQVKISFPYASQLAQQADVRVAGVSVGKVINKELDPRGGRTLATVEINRKYAPIHADAQAILRTKTILGETYVELTPGSPNAHAVADGGQLASGQVRPAVQLDEIFSAFDPTTRVAFQNWQQQLSVALAGNDTNLNNVIGNLPHFVADATDITRVLDVEHAAVVQLLQRGTTVFSALTQNQGALRTLITTGEQTFATTAAHNQNLSNTFQVFPTFLNEAKRVSVRLKTFALNTDPLFRQLVPVALDLGPTLSSVARLSPDLRHFFTQLGPLIQASRTGLPATRDVLNGAIPALGQLGPFLSQLNPILTWVSIHPQLVSDFISQGGSGLAAKTLSPSGGTGHYLRQFGPVGLETLSFNTQRLKNNRGNVYPSPVWLADPQLLPSGIFGSWDCANTGAPGNGQTGAVPNPAPPLVEGNPPCRVDSPLGPLIGQSGKQASVQARTYSRK